VRISAANIPAPAGKTHITPATDKAARQQTVTARDSYRKSPPQPQIIDAEYVEFYSPSVELFNQERLTLDNTLEPASEELKTSADPDRHESAALNRYQLQPHEAPPPGSYIDTFA
jgi:hypothetical protein